MATALEDAGHTVEIVDFVAGPARLTDLSWMDAPCDVVGFAVRDIDPIDIARFSFVPAYAEFAARIRRRAAAAGYRPTFIGGGTGFTLFPEALGARLGIDLVVTGEGEQAMIELCGAAPTNGATVSIADPEFADRVIRHPDVLVRAYLAADYLEIGVETRRRKCIKKCQYCPYAYLSGDALGDFKAVDALGSTIRQLYNQGVRHLFFTDAVFNNELAAAKDVCRLLQRLALPDLMWSAYFVPSGFDEELAKLAQATGNSRIIFSPDSFDPRMLRASGKLFGMEHIERARRICDANGVSDAWMLLFGSAMEDRETIVRSAAYANEHFADEEIDIHFGLRLLPGSPLVRRLGVTSEKLLDPVFYPMDDRVFDWVLSNFDDRFFAGRRMLRFRSVMRAFGLMERTPFRNSVDPHLNFLLTQGRMVGMRAPAMTQGKLGPEPGGKAIERVVER